MQLLIEPVGDVRCLYTETLELRSLGTVVIRRASYVEPDVNGGWSADLEPVAGPRLGSFEYRSSALAAEQAWLETYWLT